MSGHTPGPWRVALGKRYLPQWDERKMEICCLPHSTYDALDIFGPAPNTKPRFDAVRSEPSEAEHLANARLIAAAPELLEACEAMIERIRVRAQMRAGMPGDVNETLAHELEAMVGAFEEIAAPAIAKAQAIVVGGVE